MHAADHASTSALRSAIVSVSNWPMPPGAQTVFTPNAACFASDGTTETSTVLFEVNGVNGAWSRMCEEGGGVASDARSDSMATRKLLQTKL